MPLHQPQDPEQVPYEEKTAEVGPLGETFVVGGCTVLFPPDCFDELQEITVSAKIDPKEWPTGKDAIAPSVDVKATNLKKEATVTFTSWCVQDDEMDSTVEVLHRKEETGKWEVIHTCQLGSSRSITFECKNFSPLVAVWDKLFGRKFVMAPSVYSSLFCRKYAKTPGVNTFKKSFAVAVMLDQNAARNNCLAMMKKNLGEKFKEFKMSVFRCKADYVVESNLFCSHPKEGFTFGDCGQCEGGQCECGRFKHDVKDVIETKLASVNNLVLQSDQDVAADITLKCLIEREKDIIKDDAFSRYWNPPDICEVGMPSSGIASPSKVSWAGQLNPSLNLSSSLPAANDNREKREERTRTRSTTEYDALIHRQPTASDSNETSTSPAKSLARFLNAQGNGSTGNVTNIKNMEVKAMYLSQAGSTKHYSDLTAHTVNEGTANIRKENVEEQIHPRNT